ncbi:tubulin beta [Fusarium flagelliforme]|uniref:Tubulin beta n=1 Tax=Fusarium flagelliforme TaxID=2675880 RepID=A0A395M5J6_9HYPO|nr:tubulin beta [Fusarium flagelliforme]
MIATPLLAILINFGNLALAQPNPNSAIFISDFDCGLVDGNGNFVSADRSRVVITQSGNRNLVCESDVTPPSDGRAEIYNFKNTGALCDNLFSSLNLFRTLCETGYDAIGIARPKCGITKQLEDAKENDKAGKG